jgi:hypothetical protein
MGIIKNTKEPSLILIVTRAVDILQNFGKHWDACNCDPEAEYRLVNLIVERVYVEGERVVAMTLKSNYHIVLGHKMNGSTEISVDPYLYTSGSDGDRTRDLRLDRPTC